MSQKLPIQAVKQVLPREIKLLLWEIDVMLLGRVPVDNGSLLKTLGRKRVLAQLRIPTAGQGSVHAGVGGGERGVDFDLWQACWRLLHQLTLGSL